MNQAVKILGREISTVIPSERVPFQPESLEEADFAQRLKNRAIQQTVQVYFAVSAVIEPEMDPMARHVIGTDHM
jgi:hypothetical protein